MLKALYDYSVRNGLTLPPGFDKEQIRAYTSLTASGDFLAADGGKLVVTIEAVAIDVAMHIQSQRGDEVVAGGDYFVPAGVQNYSVPDKNVPEG